MNNTTSKFLIFFSILALLLTSGCYTKFYNPNMEDDGPYSMNELYNRDDSTAIDTTLTRDDWYPDTYPQENYGWSQWGRPRGYTRWGFDFDNFDPGYYRSYYGYNDYYGTPWWYNRYHNNPWWYGPYYGGGGGGGPSEPPSERPGRRDGRDGLGGGGTVTQPPPPAGVVQPTPAPAKPSDDNSTKQPQQDDPNKRGGRRGR